MANKISVLIDVTADKAIGAVGNFRKALNDAETNGTSKFKAGASSAFESVKSNAGALAAAGGAALATFAVQAVDAFVDTAKGAKDLGDATGLSTEAASRWIAVADDYEVSADQLQAGLGKISKTLDDTKWDKYGIATRDASGQARDANDILLDTFGMLGQITNETERARVGNELFGKGYANLAPLIGKSRTEYEKMLGSVEAGQVVTEAEVEKAEEMRLAQDALKDALQEVTLAVGGAVASIAPLIETMAGAVGVALEWAEKLGLVETGINAIILGPAGPFKKALDSSSEAIDTNSMSLEELKKMLDENNISMEASRDILDQWYEANGKQISAEEELAAQLEYTRSRVDAHKEAVHDAAFETSQAGRQLEIYEDAARNAAIATAEAEQEAKDLTTAYKELRGELTDASAWQSLEDSMRQFRWDMASGKLSIDEKRAALVDLKLELLDYLERVAEDIPDEVETNILAYIDQGKLDEAAAILDHFTNRKRTAFVDIVPRGSQTGTRFDPNGGYDYAGATGGIVTRPTVALIGEAGPEAVVPLNRAPGASPLPPPQSPRAMSHTGTTLVFGDRYVKAALEREMRDLGRRFRGGRR